MGFLVTFFSLLITVLNFAILGRVILSWIDPQQKFQISGVIRDITEPVLMPIRAILPSTGMLDLSPIIAFILLQVLGTLVAGLQ